MSTTTVSMMSTWYQDPMMGIFLSEHRDRKTGKIVNILEGDGEVVNVVQGHPYEPMIACSGIDSTIKIFGPGGENRERENAARGIDVANPSGGIHSSLPFGRRRMRRMARDDANDEDDAADQDEEADDKDGEEDPSPK
ncbi:WD40/YVTN repeat-like-containing domain [Lasallia pustulata]|uniref:WD40/YVTN repeat-like-containing domain n=1 Tax=Lasallia pustulata TaxID=136370 RepID=A0A1W5D0W5_9LECA|nr:WD40/YVTN repeat-like-containing domain [Lasallia pustulata]